MAGERAAGQPAWGPARRRLRTLSEMASPPLAESADLLTAALVAGPLVLVALAYGRRARRLGRSGHSVPGWRQACFYAGCAVIGAAVTGLGPLSQELLYVHMTEHLLIGDIGGAADRARVDRAR